MKLSRCIAIALFAIFLSACTPSPEAVLLDSLHQIEHIMQTNVDHPEELIQQLNAFSENNKKSLAENRHRFHELGGEKIERALDQHQIELRDTMLHILNLDLEIQDQLINDPQTLNRYKSAVRSLALPED